MSWYLKVLKQYAVFHGRARRKEYWYFVLFHLLVFLAFLMIDDAAGFTDLESGYGPLSVLYLVAVFLPETAVSVRRLHDVHRSGWWLLILLIPLLGLAVFLIWMARDSDPGENRWGPNPKEAPAAVVTPEAQ